MYHFAHRLLYIINSQHAGVQQMDLSSNRFIGSIRDSFSESMALTDLNLERNTFTGLIPFTLSNLPELYSLRLQYNRFSGPVPDEICNLREVVDGFRQGLSILEANCLSGRTTDNPCSCCTTCCNPSLGECEETDDTPFPVENSSSIPDNCVGGTYQWNSESGRITPF